MMTAFALSLAAGCATTIDRGCDWTFYLEPTGADVVVISDRLARQVLTHNERRAEVCK